MWPMKPRKTALLLVLWVLLGVPCIALSFGALVAAFGSHSFFFSLPPLASFFVGAAYGGVCALLSAVPRFFLFYLWVMLSRFLGDIDTSRSRIAIGMTIWALPEAIVVTKLAGGDAFFPTLGTLALAAWLPRALVKALRPGVFQAPAALT
jgi:hypothetical protein